MPDGVEYIFIDYGLQKLLYEHAKERGVGREGAGFPDLQEMSKLGRTY